MSSIFNFLARIPSLMTCFILRNFSLSDNEEGVCTVVVLVVTTCAAGRDKNCTCLRSPAISFFISRISSCAAGADNDCTCLRSSAMSSLISRTSSRSTSIGVRCVVWISWERGICESKMGSKPPSGERGGDSTCNAYPFQCALEFNH